MCLSSTHLHEGAVDGVWFLCLFLVGHKEVKGRKKREVRSRSLLVMPRKGARGMHDHDMRRSWIRCKNWLVADKVSLSEQHIYLQALHALTLCAQGMTGTMSSGIMEDSAGIE